MQGHVHVSAVQAWAVFVMVVVLGALWHMVSGALADTGFGKGMHVLY